MVMEGLMYGWMYGTELAIVRQLWVWRTDGEWSVVWADIMVFDSLGFLASIAS